MYRSLRCGYKVKFHMSTLSGILQGVLDISE